MGRTYNAGDEPVPGFRLVNLLGRGGFGEVWKATAPGGTEVALKVISLENKQGYKEFRAIKTVKHIRHPHLVPIVALWLKDTNGGLFEEGSDGDSAMLKAKAAELIIAMGLGDKNLLDRLHECQDKGLPGIPVPELLDYMEETAKAIDFLNRSTHAVGGSGPIAIQHCDIKPQNIMIVGGATQLCDFGLARVLGDARVTQTSMSAPYTPPEMITETKPSQTSDQYSLAITYVELRTGTLPFENPTPAGMMWAHVQGKLDLSRLPPAEQAVIQRATALDPAKRFPSTCEMVRELRKAYEGISSSKTGTPSRTLKVADKLQPGDEIVPGYKLVRLLGRGGYGSVWETLAPGGKLVALKIISNLEGSPGRQEFKALELIKTLEHNHLLELHAYWLLDKDGAIIPDEIRRQPGAPPASTLVIATKLASKNLLQRLHECQQAGGVGIPAPELIHYLRQAALAIDYLNNTTHQLEDRVYSIQHRDIKPENILLARDGTVKVGDFGLARVLEGTSSAVHGDSTGYTPHYAAPELFKNQVSLWTDQYALALTYYKLRTGTLPFDPNASLYELMMTHVEGRLNLSLLSEAERAVVAKATSLNPEDRYPTCLEMVAALERSLSASFDAGERPDALMQTLTLPSPLPSPVVTPRVRSSGVRPKPIEVTKALATTGTLEEEDRLVEEPVSETPSLSLPVRDTDKTMTPEVAGGWKQQAAVKDRPRAAAPAPASQTAGTSWKTAPDADRKTSSLGMTTVVAAGLVVLLTVAGGYFLVVHRPSSSRRADAGTQPTETKPPPPPPTSRPGTETRPAPTTKTKGGGAGKANPGGVTHVEPPPKVTRKDIKDAEGLLVSGDGGRAKDAFTEILKKLDAAGPTELRPLALLGLARAEARLKNWGRVQQLLSGVTSLEDPSDRAHREALLGLAALALTADSADPDKMLDLLLNLKVQLKNENLDNRLDAWEKHELESVTREASAVAVAAARKRSAFRIDQPFDPAYREEDRPQVYQWLTKAYAAWVGSATAAPLDVRQELGLVTALAKSPAPDPRVLQLVGELPPPVKLLEDLPPDRRADSVPYLLAKARAQSTISRKGLRTAFDCYDALWQVVGSNAKVPAVERYQNILHPALAKIDRVLEDGADQDFQKRVGLLYLAKGRLIKGDLAKNPKLWPKGEREVLDAFEKAVELYKAKETYAALSREHTERSEAYFREAVKDARERGDFNLGPGAWLQIPEKQQLLAHAVAEADDALKDPAQPDYALIARAVALEYQGWLMGDRDSYAGAIEAYTKAIEKGDRQPEYLLGRGRCYYKRAVGLKEYALLKDAAADLKAALQKKPSDSDEVEAYYWLGMVYDRMDPREEVGLKESWDQAIKLAQAKAFKGKYAFGLEALAAKAEMNLEKYTKTHTDKNLEDAISQFTELGHYAEKAKNDKHEFWAWNRLGWIGVNCYESSGQYVAAYRVYERGLPADISTTTEAHVRVLNDRNALLAKPSDEIQNALRNVRKPSPDQLVKDADHCLMLVTKKPRHIWIYDEDVRQAYIAAAFCYHHANRDAKAVGFLDEALKFQHEALKFQQTTDDKKILEQLKKDWSETPPPRR